MFARGFATWAVGAGHDVTIVGFNRGQAEELVKEIQSGRAAGPGDPLLDDMIFMAMPYKLRAGCTGLLRQAARRQDRS